jgi:hypothetical protein
MTGDRTDQWSILGSLEYWSIGVLECWSVGVLECWSVGVLECWSVGVLGCWSVGVLECWSVGVLGCWGRMSALRIILNAWVQLNRVAFVSPHRSIYDGKRLAANVIVDPLLRFLGVGASLAGRMQRFSG